MIKLLASLFLAAAPAGMEKDVIRFTVTNIHNRKGVVRCALYEDEDNWLSDHPLRAVRAQVRGDTALCVFKHPTPGTYAIAALHDEDRDGEMDKILLFPKEQYTISKNAHEDELKPEFDDARFVYRGGTLQLRGRLTD